MSDHRKALDEWFETSKKVLEDYEDWRTSLDPRDFPRTVGPRDLGTSGPSTTDR